MPTQCCIPRCHVLSWSNRTLKVSHHTFPKDPQLFKKWTNFVRYTNRDFQPSCFSTLCSKHFADSAIVNTPYISFLEEKYDASSLRIRLKADAVPTILYAYKAEDAEKADTEAQISTEDNAIAIAGEEPGQVAVDEKEIKSEIKMTSARKHRRNVLHLVRLTDINAYITCFLCGGYMYNATTITECLHSFCRKCILQHFQKDNRCPTCDIVIHESIPFSFIRQDGHLQTIINKLLPSFERMEKEGEKKVLDMQQEELPPTPAPLNPTAEVVPIYNKMVSSAQISLQLDYLGASSECPPITPLEKNFIRVSSQATIKHVQKFIAHKLKLSERMEVDIICGEEILQPAVILYNLKRELNKELMVDNILVLSYSLGMSQ